MQVYVILRDAPLGQRVLKGFQNYVPLGRLTEFADLQQILEGDHSVDFQLVDQRQSYLDRFQLHYRLVSLDFTVLFNRVLFVLILVRFFLALELQAHL